MINTMLIGYVVAIALLGIFIIWWRKKRKGKKATAVRAVKVIVDPLAELERGNQPLQQENILTASLVEEPIPVPIVYPEVLHKIVEDRPSELVIPGVEFVKPSPEGMIAEISKSVNILSEGFITFTKDIEGLREEIRILKEAPPKCEVPQETLPISVLAKIAKPKHEYTAEERKAIGERFKAGKAAKLLERNDKNGNRDTPPGA